MCRRTCLTSVVPVAVEVELAVGGVGRPAGLGEEARAGRRRRRSPRHRAGEPVGAHGVDRRLQQPRAVALAALVGVDGELHQLAVGDRVAVGVGGRAR